VKRSKRLSREEEIALFALGPNELVVGSLPLAHDLAVWYARGRRRMVADLEQEARIGLIVAASKWNGDASFATYARYWAIRQMREYVRKTRRMVSMPRSAGCGRIIAAALTTGTKNAGDLRDLPASAGVSDGRLESTLMLVVGADVGTTKRDDNGDEYEYLTGGHSPEVEATARDLVAALRRAIAATKLTHMERYVIARLMRGHGETAPRKTSTTREAIDAAHASAIAKLARKMKAA
jgi:RNA polymerase sigma factor (sigma-70 family)